MGPFFLPGMLPVSEVEELEYDETGRSKTGRVGSISR